MNASGILGFTPEHVDILEKYRVSAVVTKTFTLKPREGHREPVIVELANGGILNSMGLPNPGITGVSRVVKAAKNKNLPVIVSVGGANLEEFREVAIIAEEEGADGVELNLSCPHTKGYGLEIGQDKAMYIDVFSAKPFLSNIYGGLSGPPIHPIAVRVVYDVYKEFSPEIIATGGVMNWYDAAEFILAGARAIQLGSALIIKREKAVPEILDGLNMWLTRIGLRSINEAVGLAVRK
jgi:dihydroorotate dehydrogenase (NAD+) catalytic subunit